MIMNTSINRTSLESDLKSTVKGEVYFDQKMRGLYSTDASNYRIEPVAVFTPLNEDDVIFPMHRNLGVFTTRKVDFKRLFEQLFGKQGGFTKGRDRTFHFGDMQTNIVGMISHLAAMLPVACGFGLSLN